MSSYGAARAAVQSMLALPFLAAWDEGVEAEVARFEWAVDS